MRNVTAPRVAYWNVSLVQHITPSLHKQQYCEIQIVTHTYKLKTKPTIIISHHR